MNENTDKNIIKLIVAVAKSIRQSGFCDHKILEINSKSETLAQYLDVNTKQAILFSVIFVLYSKQSSVNLREVHSFIDVDFVDAIGFKYDLEVLIDKKLIQPDSSYSRQKRKLNVSKSEFIIPENIIEAVYFNEKIPQIENQELDIYSFSSLIHKCLNERYMNNNNKKYLIDIIIELEKDNLHIDGISKLLKSNIDIEERMILYAALNQATNWGRFTLLDSLLNEIYDNVRERINKFKEISQKKNVLFKLDLIELSQQRFTNDIEIKLTQTAMEFFLGADAELFQNVENSEILLPEKIKSVDLFFDGKLKQELIFLTNSLENKNFVELQKRLSEKNMVSGINAILYGSPGTGKTEICYQLAKTTGRGVFQVDLAQTKDMFFGESEKKVKEIFTKYDKLLSKSPLAPILLINECDGLFSKRFSNAQRSTDQTINTIQNILLEELEKFQGILLATSNMAENLDSAFERRFLFKIEFDKPSTEVKKKIWKNKLNSIDDDFASELSSKFDLSGGQINNVVRKIVMQEVLYNKSPSHEEIIEFCKSESTLTKTVNKIGYT
jgi:adenylate kinase family enzyme